MKRGRRKTPTALAKLRGNPRHERKRREPEPAALPPTAREPPTWLDPIARAEWTRLEPELSRLGLLTVLDQTTLSAYCRVYSRWKDYELRIDALRQQKRPGDIIRTTSTTRAHPLLTLAKQTAELMNRLGSQFGLSPSDRTGIGLPLDPSAPTHDRPTRAGPTAVRDEFDLFLAQNRRTQGPPDPAS